MSFLKENEENADYNQYWYSSHTITKIVEDIMKFPKEYTIAFLSTPSIYFSLPDDRRINSYVFDYDLKWNSDRGFVHYDFNHPTDFDHELLHSFDVIVIDPPFITKEVWEKYAETTKALMKSDSSKVILTTIFENATILYDLLKVNPTNFQPSIPNLVYQYHLYTNYESTVFNSRNPEIPE